MSEIALPDSYVRYLQVEKRYSPRTVGIYRDVLERYVHFVCEDAPATDEHILERLDYQTVRNYEVYLMDRCSLSARTVNLHLSVLSGFCRFLMRAGLLQSNPAGMVFRPRMEKRLPSFYKEDAMDKYLGRTEHSASEDELEVLETFGENGNDASAAMYSRRLRRLIVSTLYSTGIRRSELIALNISSYDPARKILTVKGKGDKTREIPLLSSLCEEISLYLQSVDTYVKCGRSPEDPLLVTERGARLYPVFVDRAVKSELGGSEGISGRLSPHVLRHTLATELLDDGADLNSIKELLGHSSLAATQVYTHNTASRLKNVYNNAHPRANNVGTNGDKD